MKRRVMKMRNNPEYMTLDRALAGYEDGWGVNVPNIFPSDFQIFNQINGSTTYGLSDNDLWNMYHHLYNNMYIARRVPPIGYIFQYRNTSIRVTGEDEKALYVWTWLRDTCGWYCKANLNRWKHLILADIASYDPITNYNMEEYAGNTSLTARMRSSVGTITTNSGVAPYNNSNQDLSVTVQTQKTLKTDAGHETEFDSESSISGYDADNKSLTWTEDNDSKITTPQGNATSVSKLTRKGNIGVTTSQQMIASEYELRKYNVLQEFMNEVARYTLLSDWESQLHPFSY